MRRLPTHPPTARSVGRSGSCQPPVYCVSAVLASLFLSQGVVFDSVKHVLEAFALWRFL